MYGTNAAERSRELDQLAKCVEYVLKHNGKERDVILLGDFNNPPSHEVRLPLLMHRNTVWLNALMPQNWRDLQTLGYVPLIAGHHKTTVAVGDRGNLYDNIWWADVLFSTLCFCPKTKISSVCVAGSTTSTLGETTV